MAGEVTRRVDLSTLTPGDLVRANGVNIQGLETKSDILILEAGEKPLSLMTMIDHKGTVKGPQEVIVEGSGLKLTPQQNPVAYPGQITPYWGVLEAGGNLFISDPQDPDRKTLVVGPNYESFEVYAHDRVLRDEPGTPLM